MLRENNHVTKAINMRTININNNDKVIGRDSGRGNVKGSWCFIVIIIIIIAIIIVIISITININNIIIIIISLFCNVKGKSSKLY